MRQITLALVSAVCLFPLTGLAVDINSADADTLARELNGVGSSRAQAIVAYRDEFGAFEAPEDILNVSGIGVQILDANRGNIQAQPLMP